MLSDFDDAQQKRRTNEVDSYHFTVITNVFCSPASVMVFETLNTCRTRDNLLTEEGKRMLRILTDTVPGEPLRVKAMNVVSQNEAGYIIF